MAAAASALLSAIGAARIVNAFGNLNNGNREQQVYYFEPGNAAAERQEAPAPPPGNAWDDLGDGDGHEEDDEVRNPPNNDRGGLRPTIVPLHNGRVMANYADALESAAMAGQPAPPAPTSAQGTQMPNPLALGVMVDDTLRRAPVHDATGVPGSYVEDDAPFGRDFIEMERMRLLELYLRPSVHFARLVAGQVNKPFEALVSTQYTGNATLATIMGIQTPVYDTLAGMQRARIVGNEMRRGGAARNNNNRANELDGAVPGVNEGVDMQNAHNNRGRPRVPRVKMPTESAFEAFKWLLEEKDSIRKEDLTIVREMFSKQITHTVAHLSTPVQSGFVIMNELFVSAVDQALYALKVEWRPELADHLNLHVLTTNPNVITFFAKLVASYIHSSRYLSHQWRTPKHVAVGNSARLLNLHKDAQRLAVGPNGDLYFREPEAVSRAIDYRSVYRRAPNFRQKYVAPY